MSLFSNDAEWSAFWRSVDLKQARADQRSRDLLRRFLDRDLVMLKTRAPSPNDAHSIFATWAIPAPPMPPAEAAYAKAASDWVEDVGGRAAERLRRLNCGTQTDYVSFIPKEPGS